MDHAVEELQKRAAGDPAVISLAGGLPDSALLPTAPITIARDALQYGWTEGDERLRAWIAARLAARGADVTPDDVVITAGAQQALAIAAACLLADGARVFVGDATYPGALDAFRAAGAIPTAHARGAAASYAIANVSNPRGVTPDLAPLLAAGTPLVVDEAYAELRFDGALEPPLVARARDRVWHVGTVSKTLSPGLRIGWLIAPRDRRAEVLERKAAIDLQASSLGQAALLSILDALDYDAHVARARAVYAERAAAAIAALRAQAPPTWRWDVPVGGFSIWISTPSREDDVRALQRALAAGVTVDPGHLFRPADGDPCLAFRLSFSSAPLPSIEPGVARLARAL